MERKLRSPKCRQASAAQILWAMHVGQLALMNAADRGSDLVLALNAVDDRFEVPEGHENTARVKVTKRWQCLQDAQNYILLCEGEIDGRTYSVGKAVPVKLWNQCIKRYMLQSLVLGMDGDIQLLVDRLDAGTMQ